MIRGHKYGLLVPVQSHGFYVSKFRIGCETGLCNGDSSWRII